MRVERFSSATTATMMLIAFGVAVCAYGEVNLVFKGVTQQLLALLFEARPTPGSRAAFMTCFSVSISNGNTCKIIGELGLLAHMAMCCGHAHLLESVLMSFAKPARYVLLFCPLALVL